MPDFSPIFEDIHNMLKQLFRKYNEAIIVKQKLQQDLKRKIARLVAITGIEIPEEAGIYLELKGKYYYIRIHSSGKKHSKYLGQADRIEIDEIKELLEEIKEIKWRIKHKVDFWIKTLEEKLEQIHEMLLLSIDQYEWSIEE
ncbi:MAG: hypothetical protein ACP6IP_10505 [Candidatus Njordarchaeia archaeon]